MIKNISFFVLLFCSIYCISQKKESLETKIKKVNSSCFTEKKQVILIRYTTKTRYKTELDTRKILLDFGSHYNGYQNLHFIDSFSYLFYKTDKFYYYYKHPDSSNYKRRPLDFKLDIHKVIIPNDLLFLKYLPISNLGFFPNHKYSSTKIIYQSIFNDTIIVEQRSKSSKEVRKLFLDKNLCIFKVEFEDYNLDNLQEKWKVELKIFKNTELNIIADSLNFGPYRKREPIKKKQFEYKPIKVENSIISIPLVNDNILNIDTSKVKFFIVDLWYLSCKPCHLGRPYLEKLYTTLDTSKAAMLGFDPYDKKGDVLSFTSLKFYKIPEINSSLFDLEQFHTNMHPTVLILDKDFKIIKRYVGLSNSTIVSIKLFLIKNKLIL